MFRLRNQHQIRRIVISLIAVCVMHQFMTFQGAAKNFCHHKAMLFNHTRLVSHKMLRAIKCDVSLAAEISPIWVASKSSIVLITASHTSKNLRFVVTSLRNKAAFVAIRTCDFFVISVVDFLKFRINFHSNTSMSHSFEKSKTFFIVKEL